MTMLYLGGPILYGLLFGVVYVKGKMTDLQVIVIDKDHSPLSSTIIDMLDDADILKVKEVKQENADIKKLLLEDNVYGAVLIPAGFEADIMQNRHPEINAYINNTNPIPSNYVNRAFATLDGTLNAAIAIQRLKKKRLPTAVAEQQYESFRLNTFRLFNPSANYSLFIYPSYLAVILQSIVLLVLAISFASETENDNWKQISEQNQSALAFMLSKLLLYWVLAGIILVIYTGLMLLFRQVSGVHPGQIFALAILYILSLSFQGMIAGLLLRSQLKAIQFLMILTMPAYITSGYAWPQAQYGFVAQWYGALFPFMPFVNGLRILLVEGGTLKDIKDYVTTLSIQCIIYFLLAWSVLAYRMRKNRKFSNNQGSVGIVQIIS
jgi:ABC-2 type transport system permease protein